MPLVVVSRGPVLILKGSSDRENLQGILMIGTGKQKVWEWEAPDLSWLPPVVEPNPPEI